jgi:hypothetical protein
MAPAESDVARITDEIDRIIEGIREESNIQPGETVSGGTGARGTSGKQGIGFAYSQEQGWAFLEGPSGTSGQASNAAGFDGVAFRTDGPPEIHILDNKSLAREGNVGSATAITENLGQNLDALAQRAADPRFNDVPRIQELRDSHRIAGRDAQREHREGTGTGTGSPGGTYSSGYWNTSSRRTLNTRAIWNAISRDGEYLPCSMAMMVCRVTPIRSARSAWVISPFTKRRDRIALVTLVGFTTAADPAGTR